MKIRDILRENQADSFGEIIEKFIPFVFEKLSLSEFPDIKLKTHSIEDQQPTSGRYINDLKQIELIVTNRHPNDILRTLAHELVHFKQDTENKLDAHSGDTGSPIENEANAMAGVIMREFNKKYPQFLKAKPYVV